MTSNKLLLTLVAALLCATSIYSQGFNAVYSKDGNSVFAVGNAGNVFRSYDGGQTYISTPVGAVNLYSVANFNNTIVIAGGFGLMFYSTNDGSTWNSQALGAQNLNSVSFADANVGWIVGDAGIIYKTVNGGLNWTSQSAPNANNLRSVKATGTTTAVACGDNGTAIYTNNGGTSWLSYSTGTLKNLLSIDQKGGMTVCGGIDGFALKYSGASWTNIDYKIAVKSEVRGISMIDANTYFSCGGGGFVNKTTDAGATFIHQANPMIAPLTSIYFTDANKGWAVANNNNAVMRTTDGGNTWAFQTGVTLSYSWSQKQSGSSNIGNGFALHPANKNGIFIMMNNTLYRSLDKGETWTNIGSCNIGSACHTLFVSPSDTNLMICSKGSGGGYVARSTNYGATWTAVWGPGTLTSYGMPMQMDDNNPSVVYLAPDNNIMLRSTDFGLTWNNWGTKVFRSPCDIAVEFGNSNVMWVADGVTGSGQGDFWKSTDNGVTWNYVHTVSGSEIPMIATTSLNPSVVYHTTWSSGGFWKSTDAGTTFNMTSGQPSNLWGSDIAKDDPNSVIYGTYGSSGYLSTDNGNNFITQNLVSSPGAGTLYYDKSNCFMQQGGGVYKMSVSYTVPIVTGNRQISSQTPSAFSLQQNFPNPFNPSTQIKYNVSRSSFVSIKVFDILGNEVRTLTNGNLAPGVYSIDFDASQIASGIYFYSLFSDGVKMDSKKMLLVK